MAVTPFGSVNPLLEEEVTIIAEGEPVEETVEVSDNLAEDMSDEELSEDGWIQIANIRLTSRPVWAPQGFVNYFSNYKINSFLEFPILLKKNDNKFLHNKLLKIGYDIRHTWYVNNIRYLNLNFNLQDFNHCENLHEKVLSLPTHDKISEKDIINICKLINFHEK